MENAKEKVQTAHKLILKIKLLKKCVELNSAIQLQIQLNDVEILKEEMALAA